jgi:hypothetical protein
MCLLSPICIPHLEQVLHLVLPRHIRLLKVERLVGGLGERLEPQHSLDGSAGEVVRDGDVVPALID